MNFLMRPSQVAASDHPSSYDIFTDGHSLSKPATTLEGLIAEELYARHNASENYDRETHAMGSEAKNVSPIVDNHIDVTDDEGWITIPYKKVHDDWADAPDIHSFHSLDRSFVFPGEQVHILVCLSAYKEDTEIITPFKVAAVMNKNGMGQNIKNVNNGNENGELSPNGENLLKEKIDTQKEIHSGESLLRMEDYKRQTETLLQKFKNSHFFVRVAESDEPLWYKKSSSQHSKDNSEMDQNVKASDSSTKKSEKNTCLNAFIDKGNFDGIDSGGVARNTVKCSSLSNGDIVVLLQVNIGTDLLKDPVLEILQFDRYEDKKESSPIQDNFLYDNQDPCGELLKWLLPLDNTLPSPPPTLSPPPVTSNTGTGSVSLRSNSGSQLFSFQSFGHFRSHSMSSLPQNTAPSPSLLVPTPSPVISKPNFDLEDWDRFSDTKFVKNQRNGDEGLLSFRGVSLEPDRFSVRCGLEGIYTPGRRWRRKLEIIQPIEIHSFAADCNTDDLLCVQIKNVSPAHIPDIVIFVDSITIVLEETSEGGPPLFLPLACIETGNDYSLPNLSLRRGEEHSFILKPATSMWQKFKGNSESSSQSPQLRVGGGATSSLRLPPKIAEGKRTSSSEQYAILVSCRCNYTESKLFFKQPTSWRQRVSRDIMISVASEMSKQSLVPDERASLLPVQVLTLQASNLTSEDLTLTVLAPASFASPPSMVSLNSTPSTPLSPFVGFSEFVGKTSNERGHSASLTDQAVTVSDVIPSTGLGCSHLWLQSRVPLGCVPSQSTATIKLELLPLTDGIITLDTLQIDIKEKGLTYIPEHSLMINVTSSMSTGII